MNGRIYYRSDTRPPEQIFKEGFSPRLEVSDQWWMEAIKYRGYTSDCGINNQSIDADPMVCVCMTTKLESAPIFPLNNENSYIYAMVLPEATHIDYTGKSTGEVRLCRTPETPSDLHNVIIDLHHFQAAQTGNICRFFDHQVEHLSAYAGWPLYAYESLAYKVPPQAIVCAIKCVREDTDSCEVSCSISDTPKLLENKKFILEGDVIENIGFSHGHIFSVGQKSELKWSEQDYGPLKKQVLAEISQLKKQGETKSPDLYYGLGGKTF